MDAKQEIEKTLQAITFPVEKRSLYVERSNEKLKNRLAVVRLDTEKTIGVVSNRYQIIEHEEVMKKPLEALTATYNIKRCSLIENGAKVMIDLRQIKPFKINGDSFSINISLINSYDATTSFRVFVNAYRLICENGAAVKDEAEYETRFIHAGKPSDQMALDITKAALAKENHFIESIKKPYELIDKVAVNEEKAASILEGIEFFGKAAAKKIIEQWKLEMNYKPTLYGLYNGITSFLSRKEEKSKNPLNARFNTTFYSDKVLTEFVSIAKEN